MRRLCLLCLFLFVAPSVSASYAVVNADHGVLLLGENAHEPLPVASLTKIWTAYVVLQNSHLQDLVEVSNQAAHMEGSSIYLQ